VLVVRQFAGTLRARVASVAGSAMARSPFALAWQVASLSARAAFMGLLASTCSVWRP